MRIAVGFDETPEIIEIVVEFALRVRDLFHTDGAIDGIPQLTLDADELLHPFPPYRDCNRGDAGCRTRF
jgi:hypothetical protein